MTDKPVLLQIGQMTAIILAKLAERFTLVKLGDQPDRAAFLADRGGEFTAAVTDGHAGLPADVMAAMPNLRVVSSFGVGYDAIDADAAAARGIVVTHTPDVLNDEVADTAILLWLAATRRIVAADHWARSGKWEREGAFPLTRSAQNRVVGILGLGRIGQTIARRAEAFNATILYHARSDKGLDWEYCPDLVDMAARSDVLMVITPGGPETRNLVSDAVIRALGPEGILVNVARGSVVDEPALVKALEEGALGGAGLDVFAAEPKIPEALKAMENVVLAPHVGSASVETRQAMADLTCENLFRFIEDGSVLTPVPECRGLL
ncbi:2-hydroxyacid dehydrogenase [Marinibacterium sp. SX1]|uniref:2-hydroxyacid dehydrogenase n=1 Tax=Marinibacterium sp. SX1 TaxID=3388424 RepID=UPI003D17ABF9